MTVAIGRDEFEALLLKNVSKIGRVRAQYEDVAGFHRLPRFRRHDLAVIADTRCHVDVFAGCNIEVGNALSHEGALLAHPHFDDIFLDAEQLFRRCAALAFARDEPPAA